MEPGKPSQLSETTERLGTEKLWKLLLRLSIPGVASMVSISLYHLIDTFWVGKLGYQAIAAITITLPFFIVVISIGAGTGVGANALASRCFGERDIETTNKVAGQIFILSALFGALFVIVGNLFAEPILVLCGATDDIMEMAIDYLTVFSWAVPFMLFRLIARNIFQASGDAIKPMLFTVLGTVINMALDPFLIFGWGPFPELGMKGAALATVIAGVLSGGLAFYYIVANRSVYRVKLHHLKPDFRIIKDIYRVGLPSTLMQVTESVVFALFNYILSGFGSVAIAAAGIAIRISDLAFMPIIGVNNGLLPIIGFSLGARLWKRLWGVVRLASIALMVMMGVATIILEIFTPQAIAVFNDDPELLEIAVTGMRIFLSSLILVGPAIVFVTTFQGLSKGKTAMVLSLARQFIFFVLVLFLMSNLFGLNGVWISMPASDVLGIIAEGTWLFREYRVQQKSDYWADVPEAHEKLFT